MVYGVSRIALPSCDLGGSLRADGNFAPRVSHFVLGPENRLALAPIERLLEANVPTQHSSDVTPVFNPLLLLGPTGMGKSHLARGITRHWRANIGESTVEYLTAVDFARQLRTAREENLLAQFREQLASLRLLVLEDLHRLPARIFVQRELRDTLDTLLDNDASIVITSQTPPATMPDLEAGLRDRLCGGLTVRLQNPGMETRVELLRQAASDRGVLIDDDQLEQLAQKTEGTALQLFRAIAEFELSRSDSAAEDAPAVPIADRSPLAFKQILAVVARYFSLTQAALCSPVRRKSLVYARGIAIHLARSLTDLSYAQIGHSLGRRDHTTVLHASRTIDKRLATDATTQQDVEELKRILTAV